MKKPSRKLIAILVSVLIVSCAATAVYFSLDDSLIVHESALVTGNAYFGSGYYLPSSTSVMEISLTRSFPAGKTDEISHSRIKNIQKFPVQFTLRYDSADLDPSCTYRIDVSFTTDNVNFRKGYVNVSDFSSGSPVSVNLSDTLNN